MPGTTRKTIASLAAVCGLTFPPASALGAAQNTTATIPKGAVTITGPSIVCKRWGRLQVRIKVKKTTVKVAGRKRVKIKIFTITTPVVPNITAKTKYINEQALPLLIEEALQIQNPYVEVVTGATDTTDAFTQSLQGALLRALKIKTP